VEQEKACDDMVLRAGPSAPDYAEHLLAVTAGLPVSRFAGPVALAMGRPRRIEQRLRTILDPARDRRPMSLRSSAVFASTLALVLGPLAALSLQPSKVQAANLPENSPEDVAAAPEDEKVAEVRAMILKNYVRAVTDQDLSEGAIRGMLSSLNDPYSEYLSQEQVDDLGRGTQGTFAGVGIQIQLKDNQITVVTPIEGSPALEAGVQPGDAILAIDGHPTKGLDLPSAVKRILGPKDSRVKLRLRHPDGQEAEIALTRSLIKVPSVKGFRRDAENQWQYVVDAENQIAYVAITHFTSTTADDLRKLLQRLQEQGLKGLIVDLRFCPGGLLSTTVAIAELFFNEGAIVTVKGHQGEGSTSKAQGHALIPDIPLVVLLNEQTASAAEVLAGALRDNNRATLLGTRSYGKGSVQNMLKVPGNGMVKLTTAYFYLPSGRNIHKSPGDKDWGVDPTDGHYFPLDGKQTEALLKVARQLDVLGGTKTDRALPAITPKLIAEQYADPQLAAAVETLRAKIMKGEFVPVGKPHTVMLEHLAKREDLLKKREALQKELDQLNKTLEDHK
jgi:carboxyl-terminal processing protease